MGIQVMAGAPVFMGNTPGPPYMPYDERDTDSGQFTPTYTDEDFITAVTDHDLPSTSNVADTVGCKYRTAYERLTRLEDAGQLTSRTVGNSLVWMITDPQEEG